MAAPSTNATNARFPQVDRNALASRLMDGWWLRQAARILIWLGFVGAALILAAILLKLGPAFFWVGFGSTMMIGTAVMARRAGWWRVPSQRTRRRIVYISSGLLIVGLMILPQRSAAILLLLMVAGWMGLALWQVTRRLATWWAVVAPQVRARFMKPITRWLLFGLMTLALGGLMLSMPRPYPLVMLVVLVIGALPVAVARWRAADERIAVIRGLTMTAILGVVLGYYDLLIAPRYVYGQALRLLFLGLIALALAVHLNQRTRFRLDLPRPALTPFTLSRITGWRRYIFGVGLVTMAIFAEANGRILGIPALVNLSSHAQFALLALALILLIVGGGVIIRPRVDRDTLLFIIVVTVIGGVIRAYGLESLLHQWVDELSFAEAVNNFWYFPNIPLMQPIPGFASFPYIFPYWQANMVALFGRSLWSLRIVSVILGTLNIPAMYLLARALFDRKTALIALVLVATFPPHIHFSRIGLNNIMDPLLATLALGFIARGMMHQRRADYVLGGVFLGLSHYFYEGGRLLLTPLALAWLVGLMILWRPRLNWRALVIVFVIALIVALPIYYTLAALNRTAAPRLTDYNVTLDSRYWSQLEIPGWWRVHVQQQIIKPLLVYIRDFEGAYFYGGPQGLMLWFLVPVFFLGIGYSVIHWRRPGPLLILLLWLSATAGMSFLAQPNLAARYGITFPALILFLALGMRYTLALLWPHESRAQTRILAVVVLALAVVQVNYYFNYHLPIFNEQHRGQKPHRDGQDVIYRSLDFPAGTQVYIVSPELPDEFYTMGVKNFLADDMELHFLTPDAMTRDYLRDRPRGVDYAFFIEPGEDVVIRLLKGYFYLLPPQNSPYNVLEHQQFPLYYAPYLGDYSDVLRAQLDRARPAGHHQRTR